MEALAVVVEGKERVKIPMEEWIVRATQSFESGAEDCLANLGTLVSNYADSLDELKIIQTRFEFIRPNLESALGKDHVSLANFIQLLSRKMERLGG